MKKIAIIGAGPAGLAAASSLAKEQDNLIFIFDKGKDLLKRNHKDSNDLGVGVGGTGLFSDGKISFFPSGSNLYKFLEAYLLLKSHKWLENELNEANINCYPFPKENFQLPQLKDSFFSKTYPSIYASLEQRLSLLSGIINKLKNTNIFSQYEVEKIIKKQDCYEIQATNLLTNESLNIKVDKVIIGGGRLSEIDKLIPDLKLMPMRFELGVRIETDGSPNFFKEKNNDIKKIWTFSDGLEIRTFCTCRNGEIYNLSYGNISALSGRADGEVTNFSNLGFLIRFTGKRLEDGERIWNKLINNKELQAGYCFWQPLNSFLQQASSFTEKKSEMQKYIKKVLNVENTLSAIDVSNRPWYPKEKFKFSDLTEILGPQFTDILASSIIKLVELDNGFLKSNAIIIFPCIEGVGYYPETNEHLESVSHNNIWFAGDNVGSFRGIVPAFLSGYYVGEVILKGNCSNNL